MKIIPVVLFVALLFTANMLPAQRGVLMQRYIEKQLDKDAPSNTGPAPDYSNLYYWAASPYKHDTSDSIPNFLEDEKRDTGR